MKKGIIGLLGVALMLSAATVIAGDLNPANGTGAGGISAGQPSTFVGGDKFKKLHDNCDILNSDQRANMSSNNGVYYNYPNNGNKTWVYSMVKFVTGGADEDFTCYWECYTANNGSAGMSAFVWYPAAMPGGQRWVYKDSFGTGVPTSPRSFSVDADYFSYDEGIEAYVCWILIEGATAAGARWMKIDVVDIHY